MELGKKQAWFVYDGLHNNLREIYISRFYRDTQFVYDVLHINLHSSGNSTLGNAVFMLIYIAVEVQHLNPFHNSCPLPFHPTIS